MDILDRLLKSNAWTTRQMLERCRALSLDEFTRRFDIGPGSLHDTLLHIVETMAYWAERIADRPDQPTGDDDAERVRSIDELLALLDAAETDLETVAREVRDSDRFDRAMHVTYQDHVYEFTRGTALVHVLTHGMHHRAQVLNMFRHLGVSFELDGDTIEWEIAMKAAV